MRLKRLLARPAAPPPAAPPPPALPPLPPGEREELRQAQKRVPAKWRSFDQLLALVRDDYAATDVQLRIVRTPRRRRA